MAIEREKEIKKCSWKMGNLFRRVQKVKDVTCFDHASVGLLSR